MYLPESYMCDWMACCRFLSWAHYLLPWNWWNLACAKLTIWTEASRFHSLTIHVLNSYRNSAVSLVKTVPGYFLCDRNIEQRRIAILFNHFLWYLCENIDLLCRNIYNNHISGHNIPNELIYKKLEIFMESYIYRICNNTLTHSRNSYSLYISSTTSRCME